MINLQKEGKVSPFYLEGQFVGFLDAFKEKPKCIRVATAQGERLIKLAKELRYSMGEVLQPGDWVEILGEQKLKYKTGELKLKAYQVRVLASVRKELEKEGNGEIHRSTDTEKISAKGHPFELSAPNCLPSSYSSLSQASPSPDNRPPVAAPQTKTCVMVCQKSSCRKRGADQVCQAITESLRDRGLEEQIAIKPTGCMKQCKQGPCVVFMPDKSRYIGVSPNEINQLVEKHFAAKLKPEGSKPNLSPVS